MERESSLAPAGRRPKQKVSQTIHRWCKGALTMFYSIVLDSSIRSKCGRGVPRVGGSPDLSGGIAMHIRGGRYGRRLARCRGSPRHPASLHCPSRLEAPLDEDSHRFARLIIIKSLLRKIIISRLQRKLAVKKCCLLHL